MSSILASDNALPSGNGRPRIGIVASALPPKLDGIGDHSRVLAIEFAKWADVWLHTVRGFSPDVIDGVAVTQRFDISPRKAVVGLEEAIDRQPVDLLILQYNPFCYGNKGFNPFLASTFRRIKLKHPRMRLVVMVHERFMPANSPRNAIMWAYQNQMFEAITATADVTLFSTGPWHEAYRDKYPRRKSGHMPVGTNLPFVRADRVAVRESLKIPTAAVVLGTFGGNHPSRLWNLLAAAGRKLKSANRDVRILCIGSAGTAIREAMPDLAVADARLIDLGKLPADEVSRNLQATDIYCSPFFDGVSTRRGSFFAGLQHGLATVTTRGYNTDQALLDQSLIAFIASGPGSESEFVMAVEHLANDVTAREAIARQGKLCFDENYSAPVLADRWKRWVAMSVED
jgi:glycosyltransferase involved in cell wall biosynthesis